MVLYTLNTIYQNSKTIKLVAQQLCPFICSCSSLLTSQGHEIRNVELQYAQRRCARTYQIAFIKYDNQAIKIGLKLTKSLPHEGRAPFQWAKQSKGFKKSNKP
jgi:hypothetical protein